MSKYHKHHHIYCFGCRRYTRYISIMYAELRHSIQTTITMKNPVYNSEDVHRSFGWETPQLPTEWKLEFFIKKFLYTNYERR